MFLLFFTIRVLFIIILIILPSYSEFSDSLLCLTAVRSASPLRRDCRFISFVACLSVTSFLLFEVELSFFFCHWLRRETKEHLALVASELRVSDKNASIH